MYCSKCGRQNEEKARYCKSCGNALTNYNPVQMGKEEKPSIKGASPTELDIQPQSNTVQNESGEVQHYLPIETDTHSVPPDAHEQSINSGATINSTQPPPPNAPLAFQETAQRGRDGVGFCPESIAKDIKPYRKKVVFCIALALAVLLFVFLSIGVISAIKKVSNAAKVMNHIIWPLYNSDSDKTMLIVDNELTDMYIRGACLQSETSDDGFVTALISEDNDLYWVTPSTVHRIARSVNDFTLASSGKALIYVDEKGAVFYYSPDKENAEKLADSTSASRVNTMIENLSQLSISPNGKIAAYTLPQGSGSSALFRYSGGKSELIKDDFYAVAVLDNGGMYVYSQEDKSLYFHTKKNESIKIGSDIDSSFYNNADNSEIIFMSGDKAYLSIKGNEKVKLGNFDGYIIPFQSSFGWDTNLIYSVISTGMNMANHPKTFAGSVFMGNVDDERRLLYIDENLDTHVISRDVSYYQLSNDRKEIYYTEYESLYRVDVNNLDKVTWIGDAAQMAGITSNGKYCYYVNYEKELYCVKKGSEENPEKIADDVYYIVVGHDNTIYFMNDLSSKDYTGSVYACRPGKQKELVANDALAVITLGKQVYYFGDLDIDNSTMSVYARQSNREFERIAENYSR